MRGETWKKLLQVENVPNRSTVYEVHESTVNMYYFMLFVDVAPVLRVFSPPVDFLHCHDNDEFIFFSSP